MIHISVRLFRKRSGDGIKLQAYSGLAEGTELRSSGLLVQELMQTNLESHSGSRARCQERHPKRVFTAPPKKW